MKKLQRVAAVLLAVMMCVGLLSVAAYAETAQQDGLEVSFTTDKAECANDEESSYLSTIMLTEQAKFSLDRGNGFVVCDISNVFDDIYLVDNDYR